MMNRREFLGTCARVVTMAGLTPAAFAADQVTLTTEVLSKRSIKKAIMWGTVGIKGSVLDKMKAIKEAGFEGTEMMSHMEQEEVLRARDATGLIIPSVCGTHHWGKPLSDPNPKVREEGLDALK